MSDNPIMTEEMIKAASMGMDPESVSYKRDILGLRVDPEGALYLIRDYNILNTIDFSNYKRYALVIDIGESSSSTTFLMASPYFNNEIKQ
jgi:hypothetical protein